MASNQFDSNMSLYIPRCDTRSLPRRARGVTDEEYEDIIALHIRNTLEDLRLGTVSRVDILDKETDDGFTYYIAFIHLHWRDTPANHRLQDTINDPKTPAKLYYNPKRYWILNKNSAPLSREDAVLHKRVYNLERKLLKTIDDTEEVYVEILWQLAPEAWESLHAFASAFPDPETDINGAMRDNVRAFIPKNFLAPLRIKAPEEDPAVPEEEPAVPEEGSAVPEEEPSVPEEDPAVPQEEPAVPEDDDLTIKYFEHIDDPIEEKLVVHYNITVLPPARRRRRKQQKSVRREPDFTQIPGPSKLRRSTADEADFIQIPGPSKLRRSTADEADTF